MEKKDMNVIWQPGFVMIEFAGQALELDRAEAEQLFVDLGHALQDMDTNKEEQDD